MKSSTSILKCCPFCGSSTHDVTDSFSGGIECLKCGVVVQFPTDLPKSEVIKAWNTRYTCSMIIAVSATAKDMINFV